MWIRGLGETGKHYGARAYPYPNKQAVNVVSALYGSQEIAPISWALLKSEHRLAGSPVVGLVALSVGFSRLADCSEGTATLQKWEYPPGVSRVLTPDFSRKTPSPVITSPITWTGTSSF